MLHDMITNQWLWFSAAGIFAVFVGVFTAYSFFINYGLAVQFGINRKRMVGLQQGELIL
jgi:hypothetical protein